MQASPILSYEAKKNEKLVLVVEDNAVITDMLAWALRLRGYQPVCTANGQEAWEWIESALQTGAYPAVILLDLYMPVMDGSAFLANLRNHWHIKQPLPPVILLTEEKRNYDNLACDSVLIKPFHIQDLYKCL